MHEGLGHLKGITEKMEEKKKSAAEGESCLGSAQSVFFFLPPSPYSLTNSIFLSLRRTGASHHGAEVEVQSGDEDRVNLWQLNL